MSTPVAIASDLETYLGLAAGTIDTGRATLLLRLAQTKCERITSPLSADAMDIVLEVAGRAYNNVTSAHQAGIGSAQVSYGAPNAAVGIGGLYLSKANKAELRLIAGRGSAFSADTLPKGVSEVQTVTVSATSGTFTLAFNNTATSALAFNATPAVVQAALEALPGIGVGNVSVSGAYTVSFVGALAAWPMPMLVADGSGLSGGTVAVVEATLGVPAPGQNLAPWNYDYAHYNRTLGSQLYGGY